MKNEGKKFEEDFQKSIPKDVFFYRLRDAGGWSKSEDTRFTPSNICDFILFKSPNGYLVELKSCKGASIPFGNFNIKHLEKMHSHGLKHPAVYGCVIINFRKFNKTYEVPVSKVLEFIKQGERKSIPVLWCVEHGHLILQTLKRVRWGYDLNF